jgi:MFS family permease
MSRSHLSLTTLDNEAEEQLRYIRSSMERAGSFTAVPGWGGAAMGLTALIAAWIASRAEAAHGWLATWLIEAIVAFLIGCWAIRSKALRFRTPVFGGSARRFAMTMSPPLLAGAIATAAFVRTDQLGTLPGLWLLLYGSAVVAGGASSVRVVPLLGLSIMAVGAAALFSPASWGNAYLALGFGVLQIAFGIYIARSHGG